MHSPYTNEPLEAFMAAQTAAAATLTALVWHKPMRRVGTALMLAAIWIAAVAPVEGSFFKGIGMDVTMGTVRVVWVVRLALVVAALAGILSGRLSVAVIGVLGALFLYWGVGFVTESDMEIAAADLALFGVMIGANARPASPAPQITPPKTSFVRDDWLLFAIGVVLAALVAVFVQHRMTDSADEWSYTYQAAIFARGRAYAEAPPCWAAFQNFWVFEYGGHNFSQYTPGWPLFMAPFFLLHVVWLAGPASLGLLVVGCARVARRAVPASQVRAAGWIAGLAIAFGATMLINGGSRFPHVFVAATFAWAMDALFAMTAPGISHDEQWNKGTLCGLAAMGTVATRPADGLLLGIGLFLYALVALTRRRLPLRAIGGTLLGFGIVGGLTLVILRLQLGKWFTTGYSLNEVFHPWNKFKTSVPGRDEIKAALPLATGAYCWWPCAPSVGLAGMAMLRGRARRVGAVLLGSIVPFVIFYEAIEFGRHHDFGYGPRFELPYVVPMAIGTAVALAPLWCASRRRWSETRALRLGGPAAVAIFAALVGVVRIAPLMYPYAHQSVTGHERLHQAILDAHLTNAVVFGGPGLNNTDPRDLTENLPLDLYPNQDAIVANDFTPHLGQCVRQRYPNRAFYKAIPGNPIRMQRLP